VSDLIARAAQLGSEGTAYALATVVGVRRPASARTGNQAIVTQDGAIDGWVGGACSEPVVIREALRSLADGEPRLVKICPDGSDAADGPDVVVAVSSCASEGTVEVFIQPHLPSPLLRVVGDSPAGRTLAELARAIGWRVASGAGDADAVVVATMGRGDEDAIADAVASGAEYVGLVASTRRAGVVRAALRARGGVPEDRLAAVRSPAGLDLGPCTQEEIAVAILAELVAWSHGRGGSPGQLLEATDPVCGMTVSVDGNDVTYEYNGTTYYFCCPSCRGMFEADPEKALSTVRPTFG
jgi:xanthine dehydrogenase accessory factor